MAQTDMVEHNTRHTAQHMANEIEVDVAGRQWRLARPADLESLWNGLGSLGPDERLPYWVELWPAALLLARFIAVHGSEVEGRLCLDAGCGLGLSALVAAERGARVLAFDYEPEALAYARSNAQRNAVPGPLWAVMDWRQPAVQRHSVDLLLGADILYERRFFEPVAALLEYALAPGGKAWLADPERSVSAGVWERLQDRGWTVTTRLRGRAACNGQDMTVNIQELVRQPACQGG